jgi:hypothetical protein
MLTVSLMLDEWPTIAPDAAAPQRRIQGFKMTHGELRNRHRAESWFDRALDVAQVGLAGAVLVLGNPQPLVDDVTQGHPRGGPAGLLRFGHEAIEGPPRRTTGRVICAAHRLPQVHRLTRHRVRPGVDTDAQRVAANLNVALEPLGTTPGTGRRSCPQRNPCPNPCPEIIR